MDFDTIFIDRFILGGLITKYTRSIDINCSNKCHVENDCCQNLIGLSWIFFYVLCESGRSCDTRIVKH